MRKQNSFQVELRKKQMMVEHEKTFLDVLNIDVPKIYRQTYDKTASLLLGKTEFENLKNKFVQGDVLYVLDFAQNCTTVYKDKVKSTHYGK